MAITSGFFNSVNGDRLYNAAQIGRYLQYLVSDGVYAYDSTSLQVLANDGMEVEVQAGRAMLDHHFLDNDAPITLTLSAGGSQDRIDAIIMYVDMAERACGITVKKGTPAASPTAPALTRTDVRKEYMLARVRVPKLASTITQSNITDTRADTSVCGWVTGLIKQVDTATLFLQWQTAYEEAYAKLGDYLAAQQAAWEAFFASVTEDIALPAPSLDDAGKAVTVKTDGSGYELQHVATGAPANLLDNSDFANPINQRGATAYEVVGYTIDRWRTAGAFFDTTPYLHVSLEDGAVAVENIHATDNFVFYQILPVDLSAEKNYTLAVKLADGSLYTGVVPGLSAMGTSDTVQINGQGGFYLAKTSNGNTFNFSVAPGATMRISWAALYEGEYTAETLPTYQAKGYGVELQVCQRYFINNVGPGLVGFYLASGNQLRVLIPTPAPMRTKPTVTLANSDSIVANVSGTTHVANVSAAVVSNVHNNGVTVTLTTDKTPGAYVPGALYSGFNLELSADL